MGETRRRLGPNVEVVAPEPVPAPAYRDAASLPPARVTRAATPMRWTWRYARRALGLALSAILFCAGAYAPVCRVLKGRKVIGAFSVAALTPVYFVLLYTAAQIVRGLLA